MSLSYAYDAFQSVFLSNDTFVNDCTAIQSQIFPNTKIWFSEVVPAGTTLTFPDDCSQRSQVVSRDICRVAFQVTTSTSSEISVEAWLPRDWSGRFLSTGNGGLSGCIQYDDMDYAAGLGFSTIGTNSGHNGTTAESFLNNAEVLADFSWRGIHTATAIGKDISRAFYTRLHTYSYFLGCSTGGRQGFKSAQSFPEDFDGILAGDPGIAMRGILAWAGNFRLITGPADSPTFIPLSLWPTIYDDMLRQCDGLDGVLDGIIENPSLCVYRPENLICDAIDAQKGASCLTGIQAGTVRRLLSPFHRQDGELIYPAMQATPSIDWTPDLMYGGEVFSLTLQWLRYVIKSDSSWDPETLRIDDLFDILEADASGIDTFEPDLSAFKLRGGKLLTFHGLQDGLIPPASSERYYNFVSRTMGLNSSTIDEFYRYFLISGMGHCYYGPGAWMVGQTAAGNAGLDPQQNLLSALVEWVEKGQGPESILGTKFVNDDKSHGVSLRRKHCRYPKQNVFKGSGNGADPDSWECV